jgi:hypothetical protein
MLDSFYKTFGNVFLAPILSKSFAIEHFFGQKTFLIRTDWAPVLRFNADKRKGILGRLTVAEEACAAMRCASQVVGCCVCLLYEDINEFV